MATVHLIPGTGAGICSGPRTFLLMMRACSSVLVILLWPFPFEALAQNSDYPWLQEAHVERSLAQAVPTPQGFARSAVEERSFGAWLRGLPMLPAGSRVHLHTGAIKAVQWAHHAVVNLDVGRRNLQQCADVGMRLWAEFLRSRGRDTEIRFRFTSGFSLPWSRWAQGWRPKVEGNRVRWQRSARPGRSRAIFRRYLASVMTYAGTASLARDLKHRPLVALGPGDLMLHGGSPGHAVVVLDMAESSEGERLVLLGQSYMPAQQLHVLKNLGDRRLSPWYRLRDLSGPGGLKTPEWRAFHASDVYSFDPS